MNRKQWLKTFLDLADSNSPTIEYRKKLRLKARELGPHVQNIARYRAELAEILSGEAKVAAEAAAETKKLEDAKKRREERAIARRIQLDREEEASVENTRRTSREAQGEPEVSSGNDASESGASPADSEPDVDA
jgi:peptidoglycan hydrolase CwlO-like protein